MEEQKLLTATDIVERLTVSKPQAYHIIKEIPNSFKIGGIVRVMERDYQIWLESKRKEGVGKK